MLVASNNPYLAKWGCPSDLLKHRRTWLFSVRLRSAQRKERNEKTGHGHELLGQKTDLSKHCPKKKGLEEGPKKLWKDQSFEKISTIPPSKKSPLMEGGLRCL